MDTVNKYEEVSKYFPLQEWNDLPEYEKNRFHNLLINYNKMCELGFSPRKPDFMLSRINKTRIQKLQKESDEEWTPKKVKRPKWNPPRKLAGEVPPVEQKIEYQAFVQFTAADILRSQEIYQCLLQKIAELRNKLGFEDVPEYQLPTQHRYPRRHIERKDYCEREVPDDDDYIYCDECEREWEGDCPEHGALVNVPDTVVPDSVNGPDRAEKTVPKELCIAQSSIHNAGKGVWTKVLLQKGLRFGPYEGIKVDSPNGEGYCWQIRRNHRISHYVDAWDSSRSNWMRYVNCARHEEEQNLIAFQYKGEMYYRTFRTIRAHVELLVWYGDDFGRELGIDKENYHKPLPAALKSNIFTCLSCSATYSSPVYLHNHFRYCRMRASTPRECLGAPTRKKLVVNERVCPWQCIKCKHFGNNKHVSFINSEFKGEENRAFQLLCTEKKCAEGMKHNYLSCMNFDDNESRSIVSECAKIFSLTESLDTRELKCMRLASVTSGGPKDSVDILTMPKNITKCLFMYPEKRNLKYNANYRSYSGSDSSVLGTQPDEYLPPWKKKYSNFTLHKHRDISKIYHECTSFRTLESALSVKNNESGKLLPVKTGIRKCENLNYIKKSYEGQSPNASDTCSKSLNAAEWPSACNQCNKLSVAASKLRMKERQSAADACRSSSKICKPVLNFPRCNGFRECGIRFAGNGFSHAVELHGHEKSDTREENINLQKKGTEQKSYVCERAVTSEFSELRENFNTSEQLSKYNSYGKTSGAYETSSIEQHAVVETSDHSRGMLFECNRSKRMFNNEKGLPRFHEVASCGELYECYMCKKKFPQKAYLSRHLEIKCTVCKEKISDKSILRINNTIHSLKNLNDSKTCDKKFDNNSISNRHQILHSADRPYECSICQKKFSKKLNLRQHLTIHLNKKRYNCKTSVKKYNENGALYTPERLHSLEKPYECNICGKIFTNSSHLNRHKRIHSGEKPYDCNICSKKFTQRQNLNRHKRIHSGETPYDCKICGKTFTDSSNFTQHKRIHSGEKPYECKICGRKFTQHSNLNKHKLIHSGEKPYECKICGRKFTQHSNLNQHKLIHSGEKPYECRICCRRFTQQSSFNRHKRLHSVEKP